MKLTISVLAILVLVGCVFHASAEQQDSKREFEQFMALFIGGEWAHHTKMMDESGNTTFEGSDVRVFTSGMRGNYLVENVYSIENDERIHVAIQLAGFDRHTGLVHLSQFWPWQSTKIGDVEARLRLSKNRVVELQGRARPAGQTFPVIDIACSFTSEHRYECVSFSTTEQGIRFKSNYEVMERIR